MLSRRATSSVSCVPTRSWTNLRSAAHPPREPQSSSASMRPQATCDPLPSRLCTSWDRGGAAVQAAVGPTTPSLIPSHPRLPPAPAAAQAASSGGGGRAGWQPQTAVPSSSTARHFGERSRFLTSAEGRDACPCKRRDRRADVPKGRDREAGACRNCLFSDVRHPISPTPCVPAVCQWRTSMPIIPPVS
jgi:hypothetical protein